MRRSTVLVVVAVVVIMVVGLRLLAGSGRSNDLSSTVTTHQEVGTVSEREPVGPARVNDFGVPEGWSQDRDGALAAAVSAVRLTGPIARSGFITRSDMIQSLASERYGPTLAAESSNQLSEMTAELGAATIAPADLVWSEIPLTARVIAADRMAARVEVWAVLVVGVPDVGAPRQAWRTVTVDLVWEHDDWKVDGWTSRAGPTPLLDATAAVASTEQVAEVLSWPSAPSGGE